jgi:hypothetical protein
MESRREDSSYGRVTRRELIKLAPIAALGAFAVPALQPALLGSGLAFTDWAAARWFRRTHLAPTFAHSEVVAPEHGSRSTATQATIPASTSTPGD